jgi:hypothetical protein
MRAAESNNLSAEIEQIKSHSESTAHRFIWTFPPNPGGIDRSPRPQLQPDREAKLQHEQRDPPYLDPGARLDSIRARRTGSQKLRRLAVWGLGCALDSSARGRGGEPALGRRRGGTRWGRDPPALGRPRWGGARTRSRSRRGDRRWEVGDAAMREGLRVIAGHAGLAGPPANTHRAWQAYLLEPSRTWQASTGARVADSRRRASRAGRFSCACLHPYW